MSKNKNCEERYLNFLRLISLLDEKDPRKTEGQKLIDKIYEIEAFKLYKGQNVSL
jgi:hypothetical protein